MSSLKSFLKSVYPVVHFFNQSNYRIRTLRPSKLTVISVFVGIYLSLITFYVFVIKDLPSPSALSVQIIPQTTHIRDRNGIELYKVYLSQNRTPIALSDLPDHVRLTIIAIEDKNFYNHKGFSPAGIFRAVLNNLKTGNIQGGSTITQQLVKTSLLSPEKTIQRKLRELVLSVAVESIYSKDQILEMYINRVGFGGATYGIEEASQTYFGKSASDLSLAEAALLAGLPASPTTYSPFGNHPELAKNRQREVLNQMVLAKFISFDEAQSAAAENLKFEHPVQNIKAPHFVMYVKDLLAKKYGHEMVEQGGLDVTTSLDIDLQEQVQSIVTEELEKITHLRVKNGASLVTIPKTGEILAMVGSKNYFDIQNDGNVNVTLSLRQPGSSIKPINYALALKNGLTPASIIDDSPITYQIAGTTSYSPVNYDNRYHGRISLRTALASSYNIPAVKVLAANGVSQMIDLAESFGISSWSDRSRFGLSLTLGGGEVRELDMAVAYGVFANSGNRVDLNPILEVKDAKGKVLEKINSQPIAVLDSKIAFLISDILSDNAARTPTFGSRSQLFIPSSAVAVKTGTTNNLRDNWTIGYTSDFLSVVWVGNNDNTPMSYIASGVTGASPIWRKITDLMLKKYPFSKFDPPENLLRLNICPATGQLACFSCSGKSEYFIPGTEPKTRCSDNPQPTPSTRRPPRINDKILEGDWTIRL
jgi:1A family penicillin-binding protein